MAYPDFAIGGFGSALAETAVLFYAVYSRLKQAGNLASVQSCLGAGDDLPAATAEARRQSSEIERGGDGS